MDLLVLMSASGRFLIGDDQLKVVLSASCQRCQRPKFLCDRKRGVDVDAGKTSRTLTRTPKEERANSKFELQRTNPKRNIEHFRHLKSTRLETTRGVTSQDRMNPTA